MGLNEALVAGYKNTYQNRIYDLRAETYDVSEDAAMQIINAGFVDYILEEADYAIESAKQNGADYAAVKFTNYVIDGGAVYPGEDNPPNDDLGIIEIVDNQTTIQTISGVKLLSRIIDRGEYKNYFVEDFAPALAVAGEILSEEGYEIAPHPVLKPNLTQKLLVRLLGGKGVNEIYLETVNVGTTTCSTLALTTYETMLRIKL